MLRGFNEDVIVGGVRYHIQTEDGGIDNPTITTTVFQGGRVVASRKTDYSDIVGSDLLKEAVVEIMREQHQQAKEWLLRGSSEPVPAAPQDKADDEPVDEPSLDRLILSYLSIEEDQRD